MGVGEMALIDCTWLVASSLEGLGTRLVRGFYQGPSKFYPDQARVGIGCNYATPPGAMHEHSYIYARVCLLLTTIQTSAYCAELQNQTRQLSRLINGDIIYTTAALTQQGDHALAMCK